MSLTHPPSPLLSDLNNKRIKTTAEFEEIPVYVHPPLQLLSLLRLRHDIMENFGRSRSAGGNAVLLSLF